jgi:hypothetical protein
MLLYVYQGIIIRQAQGKKGKTEGMVAFLKHFFEGARSDNLFATKNTPAS